MEEKNNNTDTLSIKKLIDEIDSNIIKLPEFQRDFVWNIKQTYDLFDSIVKDIFIGSIIYGIPSFEITVREIDKRARKGSGSRSKLTTASYTKEEINSLTLTKGFKIILDGQQRATSLYRALKNIDEVYFISKSFEEFEEENINDLPLEKILYEFDGQESEDKLSIKISNIYDILNFKYSRESEKEELFKNTLFYKNNLSIYKEDSQLYDKDFSIYLNLIEKLKALLTKEKMLTYFLLNMNTEKFALFFERSNSKGIQLNFIDILSAKLYSGFNLRKAIEDFEDENTIMKPLNREIIVRTIAYIVSNGESKGVDRSYILSELNYEHFNRYWNEVCELYKKVIEWLYKQNFIISQSWMPYEYMLIPLIIFLRENGGDFSQINQKQYEFIRYWYWSSVFALRYTGATNDNIILDSNTLKLIAQNKKISSRTYFNKLKISLSSYQDLYSYSQSRGAIYKGVLNLINYKTQGLLDWKNTTKIDFNEKVDDHHIFPKAYLHEKFKDDESTLELVDCVVNKTLIPKITNIKIGKKTPSVYLNELKEKYNPKIEQCMSAHLIPEKLFNGDYDVYFNEFLEERAKKIFDYILEETVNQKDIILKEYLDEDKFKKTGNIDVFASYYSKTVNAKFNVDTETILYNGETASVSSSAKKAKKDISGKDDTSTNGWDFWKWKDESGNVYKIDEIRKQKNYELTLN